MASDQASARWETRSEGRRGTTLASACGFRRRRPVILTDLHIDDTLVFLPESVTIGQGNRDKPTAFAAYEGVRWVPCYPREAGVGRRVPLTTALRRGRLSFRRCRWRPYWLFKQPKTCDIALRIAVLSGTMRAATAVLRD
jgi:hypothetical protein